MYKDKEKGKQYYKYWEENKRSEESKRRKKETTRLWILSQRKKRAEQELRNGEELGYTGIRIRNDIYERIKNGITKILINSEGNITCFHKNEDGHWVNNTGKKKYLHREIIKRELGLTDEDLKGYVIHHKNEDKDDNRLENLEIITQSEHMHRHEDKYTKNLSLGRIGGWTVSKEFIKTCIECGKDFHTKAHNAKYCSNACKMKSYRSRK